MIVETPPERVLKHDVCYCHTPKQFVVGLIKHLPQVNGEKNKKNWSRQNVVKKCQSYFSLMEHLVGYDSLQKQVSSPDGQVIVYKKQHEEAKIDSLQWSCP